MDRLCAGIVLLLVTGVLISNTLQEELNVHLEPKNIAVCEGESVTLNCTFQPARKYKVKLYYSQTPDLDCTSTTDRASEKWHKSEKNDTWSTFIISSIKTDDSGWYFCEVTIDIPVLVKKCSDGIQVLVEANSSQEYANQTGNQTENPTTEDVPTTCTTSAATTLTLTPSSPDSPNHIHWWIWLALAVGCVVLVVSIVVLYILTRKTEETIYENTKPVETGCWRRNRNQMEISNLAASKKTETIKPLRKYDTLSSNRNRRP
ncbi:uncharacterized protein LOC120477197 isoform X2 [Pimephales promelas]|uniref:uncharacterized protein LOC120477197 isoform X2 n=1 Tax=Pimephales promelas TaxID=90988 RepID=UPI0019558F69|nr:uncharacterized protein LOC120477197 isoform X2 [Pimephales promelas]